MIIVTQNKKFAIEIKFSIRKFLNIRYYSFKIENPLFITISSILQKDIIDELIEIIVKDNRLKNYLHALLVFLEDRLTDKENIDLLELIESDDSLELIEFDDLNKIIKNLLFNKVNNLTINSHRIKAEIKYQIDSIITETIGKFKHDLINKWDTNSDSINSIINNQRKYYENVGFLKEEIERIKFIEKDKIKFDALKEKHNLFINEKIQEYELVGEDRLKYLFFSLRKNFSSFKFGLGNLISRVSYSSLIFRRIRNKDYFYQLRKDHVAYNKIKNKCFEVNIEIWANKLDSYYCSIIEIVGINIYTPVIDKIFYLKDITKNIFIPNTILKTLKPNNYTQFDYIINEDSFACLIPKDLCEIITLSALTSEFYKKEIDSIKENKIFFKLPSSDEIEIVIDKIFKKLNEISKDDINNNFLEEYLNPLIKKENEEIKYQNKLIEKNFWEEIEISYFFHQLCYSHKTHVKKNSIDHQFIISNLTELEDKEFGTKAEEALYRFLKQKYSKTKWYNEENASFVNPSTCEIEWINQNTESFKPYDIVIKFKKTYKIEVKATRKMNDSIFYMSIAELKEVLNYPRQYIIARMFYFTFDKEEFVTKVNDDFGVGFYYFNWETLREISNKIEEWENYYKENKIRFTIKHLEQIPDQYNIEDDTPEYIQLKDYDSIGINSHFKTYNNNKYFNELETAIERLIDFFNDTIELKEIFFQKMKDLKKIKRLSKFQIF